jgi:hypothetical protein
MPHDVFAFVHLHLNLLEAGVELDYLNIESLQRLYEKNLMMNDSKPLPNVLCLHHGLRAEYYYFFQVHAKVVSAYHSSLWLHEKNFQQATMVDANHLNA